MDSESTLSGKYLHIFDWYEFNRAMASSHKIKIHSKRAGPTKVTSQDTVTNAIPVKKY